MELSLLHFHSWGFVTRNKKLGENEIKALPIEFRFNHAEVLVDHAADYEAVFEDEFGEDAVSVTVSRSLPCKWLKLNSNRITAPDVRRGDQVIIWRMGDTDRYYWTDMGLSNVKRLETAVWAFSADPNEPIKEDLSNAYVLEISSHLKHITLRTSVSNGEPFGYIFQFNLKEGKVVLADDAGNRMLFNSTDTILQFINKDQTEVRLDKTNFYINAPDSGYIKVDNLIDIKCKDLKISASASIHMETSSWSVKADTIDFTCENKKMTATSVVYDTPNMSVSGLLSTGGLSVGGGSARVSSRNGGLCVVNNFAEFKKGLAVNGGIKADTIECETIKAKSAQFDSHGPH